MVSVAVRHIQRMEEEHYCLESKAEGLGRRGLGDDKDLGLQCCTTILLPPPFVYITRTHTDKGTLFSYT